MIFITDGTLTKQITAIGRVDLRPEFNSDSIVLTYSGYESGLSLPNIQFRETITAGSTGHYVTKARVDWIAVDDAFNDFSLAGNWGVGTGDVNVNHGINARMVIRGHHQHGNNEQSDEDITVYSATGFLMGVR